MNGWKVAFWLVLILAVLEGLYIYGIYEGLEQIEDERYECSEAVCGEPYDAFNYVPSTGLCECYLNGVVQKTKVIR